MTSSPSKVNPPVGSASVFMYRCHFAQEDLNSEGRRHQPFASCGSDQMAENGLDDLGIARQGLPVSFTDFFRNWFTSDYILKVALPLYS
jgi:hypothetical protein